MARSSFSGVGAIRARWAYEVGLLGGLAAAEGAACVEAGAGAGGGAARRAWSFARKLDGVTGPGAAVRTAGTAEAALRARASPLICPSVLRPCVTGEPGAALVGDALEEVGGRAGGAPGLDFA
jgi:hypothetical protein